jgi:hypothetical protein
MGSHAPEIDLIMKNTATIGIAALLAGAAGGYLAGKAGSSDNSANAKAEEVMNAKTQSRPGSAPAAEAGKRERSMDQVLREPGQLARMQGLMDLYAGMDASQLEAEAAKLDQLPMAQRIMASFLLFGRWGEIDPQGALAFSNTMGFGGAFVRPTILQSWASSDPENAAKYFSENPREFAMMGFGPGGGGPGGGDSGASVIALEWAKLDPDAALAWANTLSGRDKGAALNAVLGEMASKDPQKAVAVAATLSGDEQTRAYSEIAEKWGLKDFAAAEAWINTLPAEARDRAMASALESYATSNPEGAAAKVAMMPAGDDRDRAIEDVAGPWARKDPAAAAAWVAQQQTEDIDDAIRPVMSSWANVDPAAAQTWISSLPQGELRDEATATFIWSNRTADPQASIQMAESIEDDGTRNRTIGMTVMRWMQEDREAATSYVQSSTSLSDEAKERLIEGRGGWGGRRGGRGN